MPSRLLPQLSPETAFGKLARQQGPLTNLHLEIVEGVLIDVLHLLHEPHGIVGKGSDVGAAHLVIGAGVQPGGSHVSATNSLDLLQLPEPLLTDDLDSTGGPSCQGKEAKPSSAPALIPWPTLPLPCLKSFPPLSEQDPLPAAALSAGPRSQENRPPSPGSPQNPGPVLSIKLQVKGIAQSQNPERQKGYQAPIIPTLTFSET